MGPPYDPETYWNNVAENIGTREGLRIIAGDDEAYHRYKRRRFLALPDRVDSSGKRVLEVGSGPGGNLDFLYNKGCRMLSGVDLSQQVVSLSQQLLSEKSITVRKINGAALPFADKSLQRRPFRPCANPPLFFSDMPHGMCLCQQQLLSLNRNL